ncbi:MAG TPA: hypothetical protein VFH75_06045, partial [Actinomycetota bacterium]|nr:hypothetical protein [Actinomycetota bacterium]
MSTRRRQLALTHGRAVRVLCIVLLTEACATGGGDKPVRCPPSAEAAVGGADGGPQMVTLPGRFAYHDARGSLWVVEGDGKSRRRLT